MKTEHTVILLAILAATLIGVGDAALDAIRSDGRLSFLEALATGGWDVCIRLAGAAAVLAFGLALARHVARRKQAEDRLRQGEAEHRDFVRQFSVLHEVTTELTMADTFDDLCRRGIELGRERLGFERLGLWFLAGDPLAVRGSFGVGEDGALRDERDQRHVATPESAMGKALTDRSRLVVTAKGTLFDGDWEAVGQGGSAVASLWDGSRIVGCLCADSLLSGRPMRPSQCELLGQYASALGHLCTRKRAEEALAQSEANFRALAENAMDGIVIVAADRSIAYANLRAAEMFGREMSDLVGMDVIDLVHPERRRLAAERFRLRLAGEDVPARYELRFLREDGSGFPAEVSAAATVWRGQLTDMAMLRDITQRKRAEETLRDSEALLRATLESTGDGLLVVDGRGKVTHVNARFTRMWRIPDELIAGRDDDRLLGYVLDQLVEPEAFLAKVRDLYRSSSESFDALHFKDGRVFERHSCPLIREGIIAGRVWSFRDVTQRHRAEQRRRESEELFRDIYKESPIGIEVFDADGGLIDANDALLDIVGVAGLDAIKGFRLFEDPNLPVAMKERLCNGETVRCRSALDFGKIAELGLYETSKSGVIWVDSVLAPLGQDAGDRPSGYLVQVQDITQRVRAEESLRESERHYRAVVEDQTELICRFLPDTTLTFANDAYCRYFGLAREGLVGKPFLSLIPEERRESVRRQIASLSAARPILTHEHPVVGPDGSVAWQQWTNRAIFDGQGGLIEYQAVGRDVTERRQAEEALRQQRDFATSLVDTAEVIVLVLDSDARIVRFNRFAQELTGYSEREVIGADWFATFLPDRDRPDVRAVFRGIVGGRLETGVINPIRAKDGREIVIRWYNSALRDSDGRVTGVLSVGHDITEILQKEQQLRQATKMEAIGRLAGGVAHEFNNMLAIIQGFADILAKSMVGDERADDVEAIRTAARRAAAVTRRLLALGRKQMSRPRVIRINEIVSSVESMLQRTLGEDIEMKADLADDLWCVRADPAQIEEVLLNLVVNARDAMPAGGELTVRTGNVTVDEASPECQQGLRPGDHVVLTVRDTGAGMDERTLSHAFEPFFTTKDAGEGSGLGLATCYGTVQQCGGHIIVESKPGEGSVFRIYLPRTEGPPAAPARPARRARERGMPGGRETVLVVEDEEHVRQLIVRILRECGYTVLEAANGRQAVPLGEHYERPIDLLVTDVVMPGMGGEELARRISAVRPDMGVVFVSGYPADSLRRLGDDVTVLAKPFQAGLLARTVREALDRRQDGAGDDSDSRLAP